MGAVFAVGEDGRGNPFVLVCDGCSQGVCYWDRTHIHEFDSTNKFDVSERDDSGN